MCSKRALKFLRHLRARTWGGSGLLSFLLFLDKKDISGPHKNPLRLTLTLFPAPSHCDSQPSISRALFLPLKPLSIRELLGFFFFFIRFLADQTKLLQNTWLLLVHFLAVRTLSLTGQNLATVPFCAVWALLPLL